MQLTILERILALNVLPKEGDITTLRIIRDLQRDLSFTEEEHKEFQFKFDGGNIQWKEGAPPKEIEIGEKAREIIGSALKAIDKDKKLTMEHLSLYEKFVDPVV
jgi:hypothetical protein